MQPNITQHKNTITAQTHTNKTKQNYKTNRTNQKQQKIN